MQPPSEGTAPRAKPKLKLPPLPGRSPVLDVHARRLESEPGSEGSTASSDTQDRMKDELLGAILGVPAPIVHSNRSAGSSQPSDASDSRDVQSRLEQLDLSESYSPSASSSSLTTSSPGAAQGQDPGALRSNVSHDSITSATSHTAETSPSDKMYLRPLDTTYHETGGIASSSSSSDHAALFKRSPLSAAYMGWDIRPETLRLIARLGEGASGQVDKVMHIPTGKVMAKKTISASPNPTVHKQQLREIQFNRECSHPNIVQYYGAFLEEHDTQIGICMDFCEAGSLDSIYKRIKSRGGRTGERVIAKVAESVLKGLVYLYDRRIIHRDIKPSNLLVTHDGIIKLCDFGVSGELVNSLAGTFVGTSLYMAPERIRGDQYSVNSDVWSLAVALLEIALNKFPFPPEGEAPITSPIDLLSYVVKMPPPELRDEPENHVRWSNAFRNYIRVSLSKDKENRPTPKRLLQHPWIVKSMNLNPQPDIARWVAQVWGWN